MSAVVTIDVGSEPGAWARHFRDTECMRAQPAPDLSAGLNPPGSAPTSDSDLIHIHSHTPGEARHHVC